MNYSINNQPIDPAREQFNAIVLHPNSLDILTIASRPTVAKVSDLEKRQSKTKRTTLGSVAGHKLAKGYQYMMTIKTNSYSNWLLRDDLEKYLALKGLQVVSKYRDPDTDELKPVVFESFQSDSGDDLTTIYITTKSDSIGDYEE